MDPGPPLAPAAGGPGWDPVVVPGAWRRRLALLTLMASIVG
jgi:hypothetical protein